MKPTFLVVLFAAGWLFGQGVGPKQFDAAAIAPSGSHGRDSFRGIRILPTRLVARDVSLGMLIATAHGLEPYQLVMPPRLNPGPFDISAEVQQPLPRAAMIALLAQYLVQQFQLKSHTETRMEPVYFLEVSQGGAKLKAAAPGSGTPMGEIMAEGVDRIPGGAEIKGTSDIRGLEARLSSPAIVDRPMIDRTGLNGVYQYTVDFAPDFSRAGIKGMLAPRPQGSEPNIFAALPEQLGLRLVAGRGPVKVLVVDGARQTPLGN